MTTPSGKAPVYRRPRIRIVKRSPEDGSAPYAIHVNGSAKPVAIGWDLGLMIYRQVEKAYLQYLREQRDCLGFRAAASAAHRASREVSK